jgi:plasmid stability protein
MEASMAVNLSVKSVPDTLAAELRSRAARNHRSLQRELMAILEEAVSGSVAPAAEAVARSRRLTIEELAEHAKARFPNGTPSSVKMIREQRDSRLGRGSDTAKHSTR